MNGKAEIKDELDDEFLAVNRAKLAQKLAPKKKAEKV